MIRIQKGQKFGWLTATGKKESRKRKNRARAF